jgi:hypothetical protein
VLATSSEYVSEAVPILSEAGSRGRGLIQRRPEVASPTLQLIGGWPLRIVQTGGPVRVLLARTITHLALLAPAGVGALFARHLRIIAMRRRRCVDVS